MFAKFVVIAAPLAYAAAAPVDHRTRSYSLKHNAAAYPAPFKTSAFGPVYRAPPVPPILKAATPALLVYALHRHEELYVDAPGRYNFAYGAHDHHTGDAFSQHEGHEGDDVVGQYSLHEADGTVRTVKYVVDHHGGFNAVGERTGHGAHPRVAVPVVLLVRSVPIAFPPYPGRPLSGCTRLLTAL